MLLPRVTDSNNLSQARFESWLAGVGVFSSPPQRIYEPNVPAEVKPTSTSRDLPHEAADVSSVH
jgi:hypothetical protein